MDNETGEVMYSYRVLHADELELNAFDLETGESNGNTTTLQLRKTRFNIPKELIRPSADEAKKCCCIDPNDTFTLSKKEEVINLQEVSGQLVPTRPFAPKFPSSRIPGYHSRMQQDQPSSIPHTNTVHIRSHLCAGGHPH